MNKLLRNLTPFRQHVLLLYILFVTDEPLQSSLIFMGKARSPPKPLASTSSIRQGASIVKQYRLVMYALYSKLVCFFKPVKVTHNSKHLSLLQNLSVYCMCHIRNVLQYWPLGEKACLERTHQFNKEKKFYNIDTYLSNFSLNIFLLPNGGKICGQLYKTFYGRN